MSLRDFVILSKIGKLILNLRTWMCLTLIMFVIIGDGAYSEVYKVKRLSDNLIYALKKVITFSNFIFCLIRNYHIGENG